MPRLTRIVTIPVMKRPSVLAVALLLTLTIIQPAVAQPGDGAPDPGLVPMRVIDSARSGNDITFSVINDADTAINAWTVAITRVLPDGRETTTAIGQDIYGVEELDMPFGEGRSEEYLHPGRTAEMKAIIPMSNEIPVSDLDVISVDVIAAVFIDNHAVGHEKYIGGFFRSRLMDVAYCREVLHVVERAAALDAKPAELLDFMRSELFNTPDRDGVNTKAQYLESPITMRQRALRMLETFLTEPEKTGGLASVEALMRSRYNAALRYSQRQEA